MLIYPPGKTGNDKNNWLMRLATALDNAGNRAGSCLLGGLLAMPGTNILVQHLVGTQDLHLNGRAGALEKFNVDKKRWHVRLDDDSMKSFAPDFLRLQDAVAEDEPGPLPKQTKYAERDAGVRFSAYEPQRLNYSSCGRVAKNKPI